MKWSQEAEAKLSKVPFFVRRRVRKRVEEEASRNHASIVTLDHVRTCQRRFLSNMESEVKGYQLEQCFGPSGCPNRAVADTFLARALETLLSGHGLRKFLKSKVKGPLKMHHEFRVSVSDCPNACSRPQIVDVGLIGARSPGLSTNDCSGCGVCSETCRENAIALRSDADTPVIDRNACVLCGQCIDACATGTLQEESVGYRILLGGKLGRHPQLATELGRILSSEQVIEIVDACLKHYKEASTNGERFGELLNRCGLEFLRENRRTASCV